MNETTTTFELTAASNTVLQKRRSFSGWAMKNTAANNLQKKKSNNGGNGFVDSRSLI